MRKKLLSLVVVLTLASWAGAYTVQVIDNFESYNSIPDLLAEWSKTSNMTLSLAMGSGDPNVHSGQRGMRFAYNNGQAPYYAKSEHILDGVEWNVSGVDWSDAISLSLWIRVVKKKEPIRIAIMDCYGLPVYNWDLGAIGDANWVKYTLDIQNTVIPSLSDPNLITRVGRIDIIARAQYYGSGELAIDDIELTVPEPATVAILSTGGVLALRRRRK